MPVLSATRLSVTRGSRRRASNRLTFSPATTAYLANVEAADGEPLEDPVYNAMGTFAEWRIPLGGACCLMTGPRTLAGALVPMVGPAPTGVNLVEGDYDRLRVQLNGSTKYVDSGYASDSAGLTTSSRHGYVYLGVNYTLEGGDYIFSGSVDGIPASIAESFRFTAAATGLVSSSISPWEINATGVGAILTAGGCGLFRNSTAEYRVMIQGAALRTVARTADAGFTPSTFKIGARADGFALTAIPPSGYSFGPYIAPTDLDTRMAAAVNAITTALA